MSEHKIPTGEYKIPTGNLEKLLLSKLTETKNIVKVQELNLASDVFVDSFHRFVYDWMVDYWIDNDMTAAPTRLALDTEFPRLDLPTDVEESVEFLVETIKHRWSINQLQDIMHNALDTTEADPAATLHRLHKDAGDAIETAGLPEPPKWDPKLVAKRKTWRYSQAEGDRQYAEETQGPAPLFDAGLLSEILARPEEPGYRIDELLPSQASLLVAALRKTGKTTLMLNLARCLPTGEKFLDRFALRSIAGQVAILNYEMSGAQLARWAAAVGVPEDRLVLVNLRGRRNPLANVDDRARLAEYLRGHSVESLIVDPFGKAYTGKSQNDPGEVGAWLVDLDQFARSEVGVFDLVLTAHMGWTGERVRGASALEDWADSIAYMTTGDDGRYFSALGRDVTIEEDRLYFDPETRLVSLTGCGSRKQAVHNATVAALVDPVCDCVEANPGVFVAGIRNAMRALHREGTVEVSFRDQDVRDAIEKAVSQGRVRREIGGQGRGTEHYPADPVQPSSRSAQSGPGPS